ncbi:hypothetical protein FK529_04630 [Tsukamurella asaccharolytica]|uniref:Helix-turn-helix domain-containing protein n=1 Tax=Tsukamurella asaccharolytica TaxID=2592067 RepID=A0A5C5RDB2_9ACTN|nr:hypothetical protein [Tsukamurella asaccharolytica]TWS20632.1 hypothetical protein FK529_04630 [Tsukamurella asaccharolytica]
MPTNLPNPPVPLLNDHADVGAQLKVSRSTVFALWKSGALASVTIGKRRFSTDKQIAEYIDRLEAGVA